MIKDLDYLDFRDISFRLKYYPENFNIIIFSFTKEDYSFFNSLIKEITNINQVEQKNYTFFKNNKVTLQNFYIKKIFESYLRGIKANIVIASNQYTMIEFNKLILPLANMHPCQDTFIYLSTQYLIKDFLQHHKRFLELRNDF